MVLRFGECRLDVAARELTRGGRIVPLSPRAFQLLTLLLDARPRALSHHELRDAVWPDSFVGYSSLSQLVTELRRAIGDGDGDARLIRTLPRFGYAFAGAVTPVTVGEPVRLAGALVGDEREYAIPVGQTLIGRGAECGVRLGSSRVSRVHARLQADGVEVWIEDAGSKNGTWVNSAKACGPMPLHDGDELMLGTCRLVFREAGPDGSTRTIAPSPDA